MMISNIDEAALAIRNSEYSDVTISEQREGSIGDEYFYGFYVTNNKDIKPGEIDPFGYGLLVSETGAITCLSDMMSMSLLEMLE